MNITKSSFHCTFDILLPNDIFIKKSDLLLVLLYNNQYLENCTNNSIYGTLKKSIFNIPIGTPIKIIAINENIIHLYFIYNFRFYSIPIELIDEMIE